LTDFGFELDVETDFEPDVELAIGFGPGSANRCSRFLGSVTDFEIDVVLGPGLEIGAGIAIGFGPDSASLDHNLCFLGSETDVESDFPRWIVPAIEIVTASGSCRSIGIVTETAVGFGSLHLFGFETGIDVGPAMILLHFLVPALEIDVGPVILQPLHHQFLVLWIVVGFEILHLLLQLGFVIDADVGCFRRRHRW